MFSPMESDDARDALNAVREVEARASDLTHTPVPWAGIVVSGLFLAGAFYLSSERSAWTFLPLLGFAAAVAAIELAHRPDVRESWKQEVKPDPQVGWRTIALTIAAYTIGRITMHLVAEAPTSVTAVGSVCLGVAWVSFYGLTWRRFH